MSQLVVYHNNANPAIDAIALNASASLNAGEYALLKDARVLHFGSFLLISEPARSKLYQAIDFAAEQSAITSYAPRIDPAEWQMRDDQLRILRSPIVTADVMQVLPAELPFLTGESEPEDAADILADQGVRLIFVVLNDGVLVRFGREQRKISFTGTCDIDVLISEILSRIISVNMPLKRIPLDDIMKWTNNAITLSCK